MTQAFNIDCMEYMKTLPDKAFDLACVDPPYGDACGEAADTHTHTQPLRFHGGNRWNKYLNTTGSEGGSTDTNRPLAQQLSAERESVTRTGGTWAKKYGKKS